jgi:hypothetical protein
LLSGEVPELRSIGQNRPAVSTRTTADTADIAAQRPIDANLRLPIALK